MYPLLVVYQKMHTLCMLAENFIHKEKAGRIPLSLIAIIGVGQVLRLIRGNELRRFHEGISTSYDGVQPF